MRHLQNIQDLPPDEDARSLRAHVRDRAKTILRDTYKLIEPGSSPSQRLTMGCTTIYPTGSTTGHSHDDMEEVYYVVAGEGEMVVGEDTFPIRTGDAFYVPPGEYHTTFQRGNLPLTILWVTGQVEPAAPSAPAEAAPTGTDRVAPIDTTTSVAGMLAAADEVKSADEAGTAEKDPTAGDAGAEEEIAVVSDAPAEEEG